MSENYSRRGSLLKFALWAASYKGDDCLKWPFGSSAHGYGRMTRPDGRRELAHRYICELAHGNAPDPSFYAAHSCGKGHESCVNPRHLAWKTPLGNAFDRIIHGTQTHGEGQHASKLTEDAVREIRSLLGTTQQKDIAKRFGVSRPSISDIARGVTWAWLP